MYNDKVVYYILIDVGKKKPMSMSAYYHKLTNYFSYHVSHHYKIMYFSLCYRNKSQVKLVPH